MKFLSLFLLLLPASASALGASTKIYRNDWSSTTWFCSILPVYSTASCPSVENGVWREKYDVPEKTSEYEWEILPDTNGYGGGMIHCSAHRDPCFKCWRKVNYKIDWHCIDTRIMFLDEADDYCHIQIGFREDGLVIWRKKP